MAGRRLTHLATSGAKDSILSLQDVSLRIAFSRNGAAQVAKLTWSTGMVGIRKSHCTVGLPALHDGEKLDASLRYGNAA